MGGGSWSSRDFSSYYKDSSYDTKKVEEIYASKLSEDFDPLKFKIRESRDSEEHHESNAIIVALDVTGSMGNVLDAMIRGGLNTMITEIYERAPIKDPQIMFMGIGDVTCDFSPVQATQFEADIRIAEQMSSIYFERHGGGNNFESYSAAWYMGALRTSIDCFEKRDKKGYLFTMGDEYPDPGLTVGQIKKFFGDSVQTDYSNKDLLEMVSESYNVFHLIIKEGNGVTCIGIKNVMNKWEEVLGQRAIVVEDATKLGEIITSIIQVNEGEHPDKVVSSWSGDTSIAVRTAINSLTTPGTKDEVVRF